MQRPLFLLSVAMLVLVVSAPAYARSCADLRALCYTMRSDKSDCTKPFQRCLQTGVFITPMGRVFQTTK